MAVDKELVAKLKNIPLFQELSDKDVRAVIDRARVRDHVQGHEMVAEGRRSVGFHMILEGTASVAHGNRVVRHLGPGDYFGEISVIDGQPRSATVVTETPVRMLSLSAWDFAKLLDQQPALSRKIMLGLCQTIRALEQLR